MSLEDIADYVTVAFPSVPKELHEAWLPSRAPSGRRIRRQRLDHGSMNELSYLIVAGKVVHPSVASASNFWGHPNLAYVPIADMPPMRSALVWRRGMRDPAVREFIRVARELLAAVG